MPRGTEFSDVGQKSIFDTEIDNKVNQSQRVDYDSKVNLKPDDWRNEEFKEVTKRTEAQNFNPQELKQELN